MLWAVGGSTDEEHDVLLSPVAMGKVSTAATYYLFDVQGSRASLKQNWPWLVARRARLMQALSALRPTKAYQKSRNVLGNANVRPGAQKYARQFTLLGISKQMGSSAGAFAEPKNV